jgi:hypothetical protein
MSLKSRIRFAKVRDIYYLCNMGKKVITSDETVNKDIALRVRITPYIDNELSVLADQWNCTRSDLVRVVLLNFIEEGHEKQGG